MYLLYFFLRTHYACWRRHKSFRVTDFYKGWDLYRSYHGADKKGIMQVIREINRLAKYWKSYPDSYFMYGMFLKDFVGFDRMASFIPQSAYGRYARNRNPYYEILINDKILFHDIISTYGLPSTKRYFSYSTQSFKRNQQIITDSEVDDILSCLTDNKLFVKRNSCGSGSGVSVAYRKEDGFYTKEGNRITAQYIRQNHFYEEYFFEKALEQDPQTAQFNPDSINTCRVLTYRNKIVSAALRMGRKGSFVDNAAQGGMVVNIDIDTGRLSDFGLREYDATKYYEHPDSHKSFKGVTISQWDEIQSLVQRACQLLPYYNSVGYDIVCTAQGPIILEINTGASVCVSQMGREWGIADAFVKS